MLKMYEKSVQMGFAPKMHIVECVTEKQIKGRNVLENEHLN